MNNTMTKHLMTLPDVCDSTSKMSMYGAAVLFMNLAVEHAEELGIGLSALMPQNKFWLTVRTKIKFYRRPGMAELLEAKTWPEKPERFRSVRDYAVYVNGELCVAGKSEWAVMNTQTGRLMKAEELFPGDFCFCGDRSIPEPFRPMKLEFEEVPFAETTVGSADIDLGGHMNNAAYIRTLTGLFTVAEWQAMDISELDVQFRSPCYEGNRMQWQKRVNDGYTELRAAVDGKTVFIASLK